MIGIKCFRSMLAKLRVAQPGILQPQNSVFRCACGSAAAETT